jgi:hypothetical protein
MAVDQKKKYSTEERDEWMTEMKAGGKRSKSILTSVSPSNH